MKKEYNFIYYLILIAILIHFWLIYRSTQHKRGTQQEPPEHKTKVPRALKPNTEDDWVLIHFM